MISEVGYLSKGANLLDHLGPSEGDKVVYFPRCPGTLPHSGFYITHDNESLRILGERSGQIEIVPYSGINIHSLEILRDCRRNLSDLLP